MENVENVIIQKRMIIEKGEKQSVMERLEPNSRILGLEHAAEDGLVGKKVYLMLHTLMQQLDQHYIIDVDGNKVGTKFPACGFFPLNNITTPYPAFSVRVDEPLTVQGTIVLWAYGPMQS